MSDNPSIETALSEAIQRSFRPHEGEREAFWASSLGMCPRKQIAERMGIPPVSPPDLRSQFKMYAGRVLGWKIQHDLMEVGYLDPAWTEKSLVYRSYHGRPDGVTHRINGSALVEIKTVDDRATQKPDLPEHYLWQGLWYCLAANIPTLVIFMVGRYQGLFKQQVFYLDEDWRRKLEQEIDRMEGLWEVCKANQVLPDHEHRFKWENARCPYLDNSKKVEHEDYHANPKTNS